MTKNIFTTTDARDRRSRPTTTARRRQPGIANVRFKQAYDIDGVTLEQAYILSVRSADGKRAFQAGIASE